MHIKIKDVVQKINITVWFNNWRSKLWTGLKDSKILKTIRLTRLLYEMSTINTNVLYEW